MKKIFITLSVVSSLLIVNSYATEEENTHELEVLNNLVGDAGKLNPPKSDAWDNVQILALRANLFCGERASQACKDAVEEAIKAVREFSSQDVVKNFEVIEPNSAKEKKSAEQTEIDRAMIKRFQSIAKKFNELKDVKDPRVQEFEKAARATSNACKMYPAKAEACVAATVNAEEVYEKYFNIVINERK